MKRPRNKFEQNVWRFLKRRRIPFTYESERVAYILARHYVPDFIISTPLGKIYVECKGYLRPEDRTKMVAVKRLNPHLDIRILFYAAVPKQIKWAEKNGFKYAIEEIPTEWLKGL